MKRPQKDIDKDIASKRTAIEDCIKRIKVLTEDIKSLPDSEYTDEERAVIIIKHEIEYSFLKTHIFNLNAQPIQRYELAPGGVVIRPNFKKD